MASLVHEHGLELAGLTPDPLQWPRELQTELGVTSGWTIDPATWSPLARERFAAPGGALPATAAIGSTFSADRGPYRFQSAEDRFIAESRGWGLEWIITSRVRSVSEQEALRRAGKTKVKGLCSWHVVGFAFDAIPAWRGQPMVAQYPAHAAGCLRWGAQLAEELGYTAINERTHLHVQAQAGPPTRTGGDYQLCTNANRREG